MLLIGIQPAFMCHVSFDKSNQNPESRFSCGVGVRVVSHISLLLLSILFTCESAECRPDPTVDSPRPSVTWEPPPSVLNPKSPLISMLLSHLSPLKRCFVAPFINPLSNQRQHLIEHLPASLARSAATG